VHVHLAPTLTASVAREHGADLAGREINPHVGRDPLLERWPFSLAASVNTPRASDGAFADATAELLALHLLREHASRPLHVVPARGGLAAGKLRRVQELITAELAGTVAPRTARRGRWPQHLPLRARLQAEHGRDPTPATSVDDASRRLAACCARPGCPLRRSRRGSVLPARRT
jgi:hypothetical protein